MPYNDAKSALRTMVGDKPVPAVQSVVLYGGLKFRQKHMVTIMSK